MAQFCVLAARVGVSDNKHEGITLFLVPMETPGITVRPIRSSLGAHHLNEVFFDDVVVDDNTVLGGVGSGWQVIRHALDVRACWDRSVRTLRPPAFRPRSGARQPLRRAPPRGARLLGTSAGGRAGRTAARVSGRAPAGGGHAGRHRRERRPHRGDPGRPTGRRGVVPGARQREACATRPAAPCSTVRWKTITATRRRRPSRPAPSRSNA